MRQLFLSIFWSIISFIASGTVLAHPGHSIEQQVHSFLHGEHLLILLAIGVVFIINRVIKK